MTNTSSFIDNAAASSTVRIRPATPEDLHRLAAEPARHARPPATGETRVAVDAATGRVLGSVAVPRPGEHLGPRAEATELDFARLQLVEPSEMVATALLAHVSMLARARYAARAVIDAEDAKTARLLAAAGFRPVVRRDAQLYSLDLSIADDGTPTRVLDNPALASLNGHHARFAERRGEVSRYQTDVATWVGIPDVLTSQDWADLAALFGPGAVLRVPADAEPPVGWEPVDDGFAGVQLTGESVEGRPDDELVELGPDDVPEILAHIERTKPGPYLPRTIEVGRYLGLRRDGRLLALAGERLHAPGWTEISAVSTDVAARGQGIGTRLVLAVVHGIRERGELPFLHAAAGNTNAIRLYQHLGFRSRPRRKTRTVRVPGGE